MGNILSNLWSKTKPQLQLEFCFSEDQNRALCPKGNNEVQFCWGIWKVSFHITAWGAPLCSYKDFLSHFQHRCENLFAWKRTLNIYWHLPGIPLKCWLFCCIMGWHRGTGRCSLIRAVICDSSIMVALVTDSLLGVPNGRSVRGPGKPAWDQIRSIFSSLLKKKTKPNRHKPWQKRCTSSKHCWVEVVGVMLLFWERVNLCLLARRLRPGCFKAREDWLNTSKAFVVRVPF